LHRAKAPVLMRACGNACGISGPGSESRTYERFNIEAISPLLLNALYPDGAITKKSFTYFIFLVAVWPAEFLL